MKECSRCRQSLPISAFKADGKYADGRSCWCGPCHKAYRAEHYQANKEKVRAQNAAWHEANKGERSKRAKENYQSTKEVHGRRVAAAKARRPEHYRAVARSRMRERRKADPSVMLRARLSAQLRYCLGTGKGGRTYKALVGYAVSELRTHLERQFLPGMTWANMGKWHIDHIIPLASFKIAGPDDPQLRRAWALTNLRPLWAEDNIAKRDKIVSLL